MSGPFFCLTPEGDGQISKRGKSKPVAHSGSAAHLRRIGVPALYVWPVLAMLAASIMLGGGGSPTPQAELMLQLVSVACALAMLFGPTAMTRLDGPPRAAWLVAGLVLLLPILQLIPLPPSLWQALPGRELARDALALVGADSQWRGWSLFPGRTLAGLLAIVPCAIGLLAVSRLPAEDRRWIAPTVAAMVLLSLLLGALQMAGGPASALRFYAQSNPGFLNGFQANRNAQADVLLIGLVAAIASASFLTLSVRRLNANIIGLLIVSLFALGVILTGSRAGIALLLVAFAFAALIWFGWKPRLLAGLLVAMPLGGLALWMSASSPAMRRVFERFGQSDDFRAELWADAWFAIAQYWPFGAGIGSAGPVLTSVERLEIVDVTAPNRVHNDYLELVLETGAFGPIVLAAIVAVIAWKTVLRLQRSSPQNPVETYFALAILAIIGLHSIVDYPLRSMSLAFLGSMGVGLLLARAPQGLRDTADGSQ